MDAKVNILLVDDQPGNLLALQAMLADLGQNLVKAHSGAQALKCLLADDFALILLDVQMPRMDGFETAALIRQRDKCRDTPIIFLTAHERDNVHIFRGYSLGAVDYLVKPIVPEVLRAKVAVFVELAAKTLEVKRQAELLRNNQLREHERHLLEEKQRWEMERLRQEAEREKQNAETLSRLYQEIQEANQRKDQFLAMLAHELRNPLAPLRNALELLRRPGCDDHMLEQARSTAQRQVQHLSRLVDDLLDVSRISRGLIQLNKEPIELATVVARAVESTQPLFETRRHELEVNLPPAPIVLEADATRLEQVLVNLLNNAAKYTKPGGHVRLTADREGDDAVLRVRDNGVGISPDTLPKVFDLFVQADRSLDRSDGGLGIGLTLVRNLVQMHGGSVQASSEGADRGSEFLVRLPLPEAPPSPQAVGKTAGPNNRSVPNRRILVVDDNLDAAQSLALLLELSGHEVRTAHDGLAALETAKSFRPDVILLDIGLPRMDGYEVARRIRQEPELKNLVLLALSGYGHEEDRRRSHGAGFDAHLTKPVDLDELQDLLSPAVLSAERNQP